MNSLEVFIIRLGFKVFQFLVKNSSTSARVGMEGWAPWRVTLRADAALAKRRASAESSVPAAATASAPQNTSPAAVVSTAFTRKAGTVSEPPARSK